MRNRITYFVSALLCAMLAVPQSAMADEELVAVTENTVWDFSSLSFTKSTTEGQLLQGNTIYVGANVNAPSGNRATFSAALGSTPTALGENMFSIKTGAAGQVIMKLSAYNTTIKVSDGTTDIATFESGNGTVTYHGGNTNFNMATFQAEADKQYYIYKSAGDGGNPGIFTISYYPSGNQTTTVSTTEETSWKFDNLNYYVIYKGITKDNLFFGNAVVQKHQSSNSDKRLAFGGLCSKTLTDITETSDNVLSFKIAANAKGTFTIKPSCYNGNIRITDGTNTLKNYEANSSAHGNEQSFDINNASASPMTIFVYSDTPRTGSSIDASSNVGVMYMSWTPEGIHNYTINAVDENGTTLAPSMATGKAAEDQNYTITGLPKAVSYLGKYYVLNDANVSNYSRTFTMGTEDAIETVTYTKDASIVYFAEVENLGNSEASSLGNYSGGKYGAIASGKFASLTTLGTGSYQLEGNIIGSANRNLVLRSNNANSEENKILGITSAGLQTQSFSLASSTSLYLSGYTVEKGPNRSADIDYIIIRRTNVPVTVTNTWATYANHDFDLNFDGISGLVAFKAAVNGTAIEFTPVTEAPAGTGLLLKAADSDTKDVSTVANAAAIEGNLMYAPTEAVAGLGYETGGYHNYILTQPAGKTVGFYRANNNSVAVGKAYLRLPGDSPAGARDFTFIGLEGETTGITEIDNEQLSMDHFYNLAGQRVAQPSKGLYIVNGKKAIVK